MLKKIIFTRWGNSWSQYRKTTTTYPQEKKKLNKKVPSAIVVGVDAGCWNGFTIIVYAGLWYCAVCAGNHTGFIGSVGSVGLVHIIIV